MARISLVATVKDAAPHLPAFLASIRAQTRPPDEVIVVDGGSTDGTIEALRDASDLLTLVEAPGTNIAEGRNLAVRKAANEAIAVSDADCVLDAGWLARLGTALEAGADVAMGFYRPAPRSFLEACAAGLLPEVGEVDPQRFMPSARSVAFTREAFEAGGGYPEWLPIGEDMLLDHRWRRAGLRMEFVPGALVYWRPRPTLAATWRQYLRYAEGDAIAGMYPQRHAARFAAYAAALAAARRRRPLLLGALALAAVARAVKPVARARRLLNGSALERTAAVAAVPALMAFTDAAKMAGYLRGTWRIPGGREGFGAWRANLP